MAAFFMNHAGTILVGLVLLLAVGLILRSMYRAKKAGKDGCGCGSCGGGCSACGMTCQSKERNRG